MATNSRIEWTDHTFNPWRGCTKVHEGCANCYAERDSKRFPNIRGVWGQNGTRVVASDASWRDPVKWNRWAIDGVCPACHGHQFIKDTSPWTIAEIEAFEKAKKTIPTSRVDIVKCEACAGTGKVSPYRARVFCASLADVFEGWDGPMHDHNGGVLLRSTDGWIVGTADDDPRKRVDMDDCRRRLFDLIDATPHLDWQLVTKRPENVRDMWTGKTKQGRIEPTYRSNVWLMTSVSNQRTADVQIPELLKCRDLVPVLGLSAEPLLGPIDLTGYLTEPADFTVKTLSRYYRTKEGTPSKFNAAGDGKEYTHVVKEPLPLNWIIVGGESGPGARQMQPEWAKQIRDQCVAAGVPFFFKQWGEFGEDLAKAGKKAAGRVLEGKTWDQMPTVERT